MKARHLFFLVVTFVSVQLFAQFGPENGVKASVPQYVLIQHATIMVKPGQTLQDADLLLQNGKIVQVGKNLKQDGAVALDYTGKVLVPAFIDMYSSVGLDPVTFKNNGWRPQLESNKEGAYYWNEAVHPELAASTAYKSIVNNSDQLQQSGFGFALTHHMDGIVRGSAAFVALAQTEIHKQLIAPKAAQVFSFSKGGSHQTYPSSQMGSIALLRQALYDLDYYSKNKTTLPYSVSLAEWESQRNLPILFKTEDKWEILRAQKIANEFKTNFLYLGSGNEYAIASELKGFKIVLPLVFPAAYEVNDPYLAREIPMSDLKHWESAPSNAMLLKKEGLDIALTSYGLKSADQFWAALRKAMARGLSATDAMAALTTVPANWMGLAAQVGTLESGKWASFSVFSADPFAFEAQLLETWSLGEARYWKSANTVQLLGTYSLRIADVNYELVVTGTAEKPQGKVLLKTATDTLSSKATIQLKQQDVSIQFLSLSASNPQLIQLHAKALKNGLVLEGEGTDAKGTWFHWSAIQQQTTAPTAPSALKPDTTVYGQVWFPNMAFGTPTKAVAQTLLFKNATVWTNEKEGVLKGADVLVVDGKIKQVSRQHIAAPAGARIIDAAGMHLTTGIIDEHSHIAISRGVNEGGQAITAEVSIGDVVNPDDIDIYRQLAGGVTAAQLLHGSANPIGGQSALVKLKWGATAEDMLIDNAPSFIKCALGENVKQANWGDFNTVRFPQTRMGVEQVFYDGFYRAKAYQKEWDAFKSGKTKVAPRVDLELEVLADILRSECFITCHSYIQSEINMLMHVADSMGFRINTFTHILEGYKVADKMHKHGVVGSTFSDWWAYKFEVNDAIPYNAALMTEQGVTVCINSDDAEMGRRLNQEAAKTVKYGGLSEEQAWKLVTLNPAKALHLDDQMGSVKIGKAADLVLWTANPLSIEARVSLTMVDGVVYYEEKQQAEKQAQIEQERTRILSLMLAANERGEASKTPQKKVKKHFHCDTLGEEATETENSH
ncbi:MAG: amidohydrolase family protein [Crocinitomicaceae bacterium]|nr:amidohydrolase family protein [Crocinitomicaceae bacterium]MDP4723676.1 amidohydrolase family protein [Crocinitomicaceae bacterium]MDP4738537.1 amidohydrolase family protein [Crocinitomicaceae bacterium]MDP4798673.1 amidohydrolase family protein [Crocinitomicaceae bacterium]MDP4954828.1 amidohydrolase family protein [Crocinitomicaceae bacterium]